MSTSDHNKTEMLGAVRVMNIYELLSLFQDVDIHLNFINSLLNIRVIFPCF